MVPPDRGVQQKPRLGHVLAFQHIAHALLQLIRRDIRQKTQPATVDAQHGNIGLTQCPRRAQQTAVTPDHYHQIAQLTHILTRAHLQLMPGQKLGHRILENDRVPPVQQKALQAAQGIHDTDTAQTTDQPDTAEMLHKPLSVVGLRNSAQVRARTAVIIRS